MLDDNPAAADLQIFVSPWVNRFLRACKADSKCARPGEHRIPEFLGRFSIAQSIDLDRTVDSEQEAAT